ncbi:MAG: polysaccharide deacetylase family protein [Bacteroidetes bacterium]|nr:polysaccharide deacetylase family protein [Bacteroidota bacterium]
MRKKSIMRFILFVYDLIGVNRLFRYRNRKKALILWYHGICEEGEDQVRVNFSRHISKSLFRKQLSYLTKKGYHFISLSELVNRINNKESLEKCIVITFDDGFKNVVSNAYPIMKEFGAKGCFYLVSDFIGTKNLLWTDKVETVIENYEGDEFVFRINEAEITYPLNSKVLKELAMDDIKLKLRSIPDKERQEQMEQFDSYEIDKIQPAYRFASWDEIVGLNSDIFEIGSHTRMHPNITQLIEDQEFKYELQESKLSIEQRLNNQVHHFCYPAGAFDDKSTDQVKKFGYISATTIIPGFTDHKSNPYRLKRIGTTTSWLYFKAKVSGSYYFLKNFAS